MSLSIDVCIGGNVRTVNENHLRDQMTSKTTTTTTTTTTTNTNTTSSGKRSNCFARVPSRGLRRGAPMARRLRPAKAAGVPKRPMG